MATKRCLGESSADRDQTNDKRSKTLPSLDSVVISETVALNVLQEYFWSAFEPTIRRVVNEEMESGLRRNAQLLTGSPSLKIEPLEPKPSTLQLSFSKEPLLPIFTGRKIVGIDNNPLQVLLRGAAGDQMAPTTLPHLVRVEIVVVNSEFPRGGWDTWTGREFDDNIVRERTGKRPLLIGDLNVTLRDGFAPIADLEFTDNSSWVPSRMFRLGARVAQGSSNLSVRICEAITGPFIVRDHRGVGNKKNFPPSLQDDVWRLVKIGKDGVFHKKLASHGIHTVQDFLKMCNVYPLKLKKILGNGGNGMSDKMWEKTVKHARTCPVGRKLYMYRGPNYTIILNPVCEVVRAVINGQTYHSNDLTSVNRACMEQMVADAYMNWNSLEEIDGRGNETALLTQGDLGEPYRSDHQAIIGPYQPQQPFPVDEPFEMAYRQAMQ